MPYKHKNKIQFIRQLIDKRNIRGLVVKLLECSLEVSEFEPQSRYNVRFRLDTFEKYYESLSPAVIG